jgi:ATP-binding cassette subfamily C protein
VDGFRGLFLTLLASPFLKLISSVPSLRRGTFACVGLALVASASEIAVALSMVPVLASLGVDAGGELSAFVGRIPPAGWLITFAVAAAVRSAANWLSSVQDERSTQEMVVLLQSRLYRALAGAHWDTVRRLAPPTISSALQTQTYDAVSGFGSLIQVIAAALLVIGYVLSAAAVFPLMLPVLVALLVLMWALNARQSDRVHAHAEDYVDATTELHQRYEDWVAVSRISSLGVDAGKLADRFESRAREAASHAVGYRHSAAATNMRYEAAVAIGILVGVPVAWRLETPPALLVFGLLAFLRVLPRASSIQIGYQGLVSAVAPLQAIERLAIQLERDPVVRPAASMRLDWQQLELAYVGVENIVRKGGRRWLLHGANLELRHGEWLAVTGPTGAGKTTLAEVMLMIIRPDAGALRIDGQPVDEELAGAWRNQATYVPQDVVLFDGSIRENLRLYAPTASDAELEAALRKAAADFVFERLPDGLDTRAGPGGRWLSGGERQRIGIARALLKKPGFLVLDEPTAALDADTQDKLMDALSNLEHKMSVVLITHRPELLRLADRIIGIEDGRIKRRDDGFRRSDPGPRRP